MLIFSRLTQYKLAHDDKCLHHSVVCIQMVVSVSCDFEL